MVNVIIHFSGLCAFIPAKSIDQVGNAATVALVDASRSHHAPHHCVCFAEPKVYQYDPDQGVLNRTVDVAFNYEYTPGSRIAVNGCHLTKEQLTLVGRTAAGTEVPLSAAEVLTFSNGALTHPCPTTANQSFFNWVAEMARVGAGTVNPAVVTAADGGGLLGARMRLTQGNLRCGGFRANPPNGYVRWSYGGSNSALAEEVAWEVAFPATTNVVEVVLKSAPLGAGTAAPDLVLRPQGGLVEAWILNMPLNNMLGFDPVNPLAPDHHFLEFFRLANGNPTPSYPIPDSSQYCTPPTGAANPKCPPTVFSPYP